MFGIGFQEMLVILVVVLIFFGPKRLPDLAKSIGKGIAEFKKASEEVRQGIQEAMKEEPPTASGSEAPAKEAPGGRSSPNEIPPGEAPAGGPLHAGDVANPRDAGHDAGGQEKLPFAQPRAPRGPDEPPG